MAMDQQQSGRPTNASRPTRRSLVEFALPVDGMPADPPSSAQRLPAAQGAPAGRRDVQVARTSENRPQTTTREALNRGQTVATLGLRQANGLHDAIAEDYALFHPGSVIISAAAKAAKDYRSSLSEHLKISVHAALDFANTVISVTGPTISVSEHDMTKQAEDGRLRNADDAMLTLARFAGAYRASASGPMTENIKVALEYSQRFADAQTLSEFVEISINHACRQLEMIVKHMANLRSLAACLIAPNVEPNER